MFFNRQKRLLALAAAAASAVTIPAIAAPATPASAASATASAFTSVVPCRLADTRGGDSVRLGPTTIQVQVAGRCGIPSDATAAQLTIVADQATAAGFLTAWASDLPMPTVSAMNFGRNEIRTGSTVTNLSADGSITVFTNVETNVVIDVTGAFSPSAATNKGRIQFLPTAQRMADTRVSGRLGAGATTSFPIPAGVPADALAVVGTVTTVGSAGPGFVTVWPAGSARPLASSVNTDAAGQVRAVGGVFPVSADGVSVYSMTDTDVVIDVNGYITGESSAVSGDGLYVPVTAARLLDTRDSRIFASSSHLSAADTILVTPGTVVPRSAGFIGTVTAVDPTADGFLTVGSGGNPVEPASSLNYRRKEVAVAALAISPATTWGVQVTTSANAAVLYDVAGYLTGQPAANAGIVPARKMINPLPYKNRVFYPYTPAGASVVGDAHLVSVLTGQFSAAQLAVGVETRINWKSLDPRFAGLAFACPDGASCIDLDPQLRNVSADQLAAAVAHEYAHILQMRYLDATGDTRFWLATGSAKPVAECIADEMANQVRASLGRPGMISGEYRTGYFCGTQADHVAWASALLTWSSTGQLPAD